MAVPAPSADDAWWRIENYDFDLPPERVADRPAEPREAARLLRVADGIEDLTVGDLPRLLRPGDLLVVNDTRVLPARLVGRRGPVPIEITLLRPGADGTWRAFARPAKRLGPGDTVAFAPGFEAEVLAREEGEVALRFGLDAAGLRAALERHGAMPLPPYIRRDADARDRHDYQTVFAREDGAVAAPTAGLHFTSALLAALDAEGVARASVTLHVGAGTFLPPRSDDLRRHRMHAEWMSVPPATVAAVAAARASGGRVVAVGTTSLRALETAAEGGTLRPFDGETTLFVRPGFAFHVVDALLTNFHLPRSTLFVLVAAFAGLDRMRAAYAHAIGAGYRFFSYGDCCFLERT